MKKLVDERDEVLSDYEIKFERVRALIQEKESEISNAKT
jgi:hypothetical protein